MCHFLLVNNMYVCHVPIPRYCGLSCDIFTVNRGVPIFNAFVWNKPLTGDYEICPQQTRNIALLCAKESIYDTLNCSCVTHKGDR